MSDLISRKALIEALKSAKKNSHHLHELLFFDGVMAIVDNQPTAYDVEKVVEQLENIRKDEGIRFADQVVNRAINIVKGGLEE